MIFIRSYPFHSTRQSTPAAESPDNLAIIPALHGDGSIPLPFVFCHLAMSIMENPPFSPDSHGSEGGRSFSQTDN